MISSPNRSTTMAGTAWMSLLRLLSISILCIPFSHVYPFQSMYTPSALRTIDICKLSSSASSEGSEKKDKRTIQWEKMLALLSQYKDREGNANLPFSHIEDGEKLGYWLHVQRQIGRAGRLREDRKAKLDSLGVRYELKKDQRWEGFFQQLCAFKEREGHMFVPLKHREEGETKDLFEWVANQRRNFRDGVITTERKNRLESIGFEWDVSASKKKKRDMRWEKMFALLCRYIEREGRTEIPVGYLEDDEPLGNWVGNQRISFAKGILNREREEKLLSVGVRLTTNRNRYHKRWQMMFNLLCAYKKREGNANVPKGHKENDENLGLWLYEQRIAFRNWVLDEDKVAKLESIGIEWDNEQMHEKKIEMQWQEMLDLLCTYRDREGDVHVPQQHKEGGKPLGLWLNRQRVEYSQGNLRANRRIKLESICENWHEGLSAKEAKMDMQWEKMFLLLCAYKEREKSANPIRSHREEGEKLGEWLHRQKELRTAGKLKAERANKLESLGVRWFGQHSEHSDLVWTKKFELVVRYKDREGTARVPDRHEEDGEKLGKWLSYQRHRHKTGKLSAERASKLISLGAL